MEQGPAAQALQRVLSTYEQQIEALEKAIEAHLDQHPELSQQRDLLVSIPGVGLVTAALVLSELGDIRRFESAREAAAYAGLTPAHHISGTRYLAYECEATKSPLEAGQQPTPTCPLFPRYECDAP